jgi:membrane protease YdiL (CAAX protease family)
VIDVPGLVAARASTLRLSWLLVRFRWRHLGNGLLRARGGTGFRLLGLVAILVPGAYLTLFFASFRLIADVSDAATQVATAALVSAGLALGNLMSKVVAGDAVLAGSPENEFFLARPVGLARLTLARSLAAGVSDLFGALFLVPVLLAVAWTWGLGLVGLAIAVGLSMVAQISIVALAQAIQMALVRIVPPARRRLLWTALGLGSAATVAGLWVLASFVLRQPAVFVGHLQPFVRTLSSPPFDLLAAPLASLRDRDAVGFVLSLVWLAGFASLSLLAAGRVARGAQIRGWEDAAAPWAEAGARPRPRAQTRRRGPLSVAGKDLLSLSRDPARLVALLCLPVIFVGVQVFAAAGVGFLGESPRRIGMLAYSLAAYLATIGPFPHMQAERRAFWILRTVPASMSRLMAQKAAAWAALVSAVAGASFVGLTFMGNGVAGFATEAAWILLLVVGGAAALSVLAVAMGCDAADLTRVDRGAVSPGAVYLFLVVAGLFNVMLSSPPEVLVRGLVLYAAAIALLWDSGMENARSCLDPDAAAARRGGPSDGVLAAIILFLGAQAMAAGLRAGGNREVEIAAATTAWSGLVGLGAAIQIMRRRRGGVVSQVIVPRWRKILRGIALGALAALALRAVGTPPLAPSLLLVIVTAEELVFRGLLQPALEQRWARGPAPNRVLGTIAAGLVTLAVSIAAGHGAFGGEFVLVHAVATLVRGLSGSSWAPWLGRVAAVI